MKNIAIIGSGTWGVALAMHLSNIGHNVKLWAFMQEEADNINIERKCKFLPDVRINDNITCYTDIQKSSRRNRHDITRYPFKIC